MNDGPSYAPPVAIGAPMTGETVSVVEASDVPGFEVGDLVVANTGWQDYGVSDGRDLRPIDPEIPQPSQALGVLGMPGLTAYVGLLDIGQPRPGETVVVAAATGAVGSLVGQIATISGCRAVGVGGGREKCEYAQLRAGVDRTPQLLTAVLRRRLKIQGFIIFDHYQRMRAFQQEMSSWLRDGRVRYREQLIDGLENAPRGLMGLLRGENFGKLLVRVS